MISRMPWVKIWTDTLDDPKMSRLSPATKWHFIELLLLAGECDKDGLIPLSLEEIAWRLRQPQGELKTALNDLIKAGIMRLLKAGYFIVNFSKRQGRPQYEKREEWAERQRKHRERLEAENVTRESRVSHASRGRGRGEGEEEEDVEGEGDADAPPPPEKSGPLEVLKKISRLKPPDEILEDLAQALGQAPDEARLRLCLKEWVKRGYKRTNWEWVTDWYVNGIRERSNGHKPAKKSGHALALEHLHKLEEQHGK